MLTCLDGILLCGQTVGIVAHGVQHIEALLTLVAGIDIAGNIAKGMAYMKSCPTRIREHVQHVELLLVLVLHHAISAIFHPSLLPFLFDVSEIVIHSIYVLIVSVHINLGCKDTKYFRQKNKRNTKKYVLMFLCLKNSTFTLWSWSQL